MCDWKPVSVWAVLLALASFGCQSQQVAPSAPAQSPVEMRATAPVTSAPAQTAPTAVPDTIRLGLSIPVTGPSARIGQNDERFIRMSIDDVNAKGGVTVGNKTYRFEAVTVDDKGTAEGGRDAANRLVLSEKVRFILGSFSASAAAQQVVTEPAGVLLLALFAIDKSLAAEFPLTLHPGPSHNYMRYNALYDWLAKTKTAVKRIVWVGTDDVTGRALAAVSKAEAEKRGMSIVATEFFPADLQDFSALTTRVLRHNPDALDIFAGGRGPIFLGLMKALNEQGFKKPSFAASAEATTLQQGAAFIQDFTWATMGDWKTPIAGPTERGILTRMVEKYGQADLEAYVDAAYNILPILAQGMTKAGTVNDNAKIAQTLRAGEWDTLWSDKWGKSRFVGVKTFGQSSTLEQPIYLSKAEGDKLVTFDVLKGTLP